MSSGDAVLASRWTAWVVTTSLVWTTQVACSGSGAGPPDPARFETATCEIPSELEREGEIELGAGWREFRAIEPEGTTFETYEKDSETYIYYSIRTQGVGVEDLCVHHRLDVAEPDEPNEAVAFDRHMLTLDETGEGSGQLLGIPIHLTNPSLVRGKPVRLFVDVVDPEGVGAHGEEAAHVQNAK